MALNLTYTAIAIATLGFMIKLIKALTNPLNAIPGPWYTRFTGLPATLATLSKQQVQYYDRLHKKYGHYVRVSPSQVFVSDVESFKAIHKISNNFPKADYYHYFGPTEAGKPPYGLFQMTSIPDHAQRRKLLGRGFTTTFLRTEWEAMVREKASAAIEGMENDARFANGEVDVRKWWVLMACDVISQLMFGESFDALKAGKQDPWFDDVKIGTRAAFAALSFPWLYSVLKRLPVIGRARPFHSHKIMLGKGVSAVANSKKAANSQTSNLFTKVLDQAEKPGGSLTDEDICVEAGAFMIAGTDTTSNTLTYLIWAIVSRPELRRIVEQEVSKLQEPLSDAQLEKLPVLHAVIEETLRLYGAAPMPLPRIVPKGGFKLGDYFLPAGAEVATQSFTMHRDSKIYHDPERFDHTRWLPGGECQVSEAAKAAFSPFGAGARVCIGKHLAYMELRYGAAMFFRRFKGCRLAPSTTPESMDMDNLVLIEPRGKVCKVILPVP